MTSVSVYLWQHYNVSDSDMERAENAVDEMDSQIDSTNIRSFRSIGVGPEYEGVSDHDGVWELVEDFATHVLEHESDYVDANSVHLLIFNSSLSIPTAGGMRGSVGDGNGASDFDDDGAVGVVNTFTKNMANALYGINQRNDGFRATVMHEVGHALTDTGAWYYDSPDSHCRDDDDSSPDHSLGRIRGNLQGRPVTPMSLWYTRLANNSTMCNYCHDTDRREALSISETFTECAVEEFEDHLDRGV